MVRVRVKSRVWVWVWVLGWDCGWWCIRCRVSVVHKLNNKIKVRVTVRVKLWVIVNFKVSVFNNENIYIAFHITLAERVYDLFHTVD